MDALKNAVNLHGGAYDPAGVHIDLHTHSMPGDAWNGRLIFCSVLALIVLCVVVALSHGAVL